MKLPRLCLPGNGRLPSCCAPGQPWVGRSILGQRGRPTQAGVPGPLRHVFLPPEGPSGGSPRRGSTADAAAPKLSDSWPHGADSLDGISSDRGPCQHTLVSPEAPLGHPGGGLHLGGGLAHTGTEGSPGTGPGVRRDKLGKSGRRLGTRCLCRSQERRDPHHLRQTSACPTVLGTAGSRPHGPQLFGAPRRGAGSAWGSSQEARDRLQERVAVPWSHRARKASPSPTARSRPGEGWVCPLRRTQLLRPPALGGGGGRGLQDGLPEADRPPGCLSVGQRHPDPSHPKAPQPQMTHPGPGQLWAPLPAVFTAAASAGRLCTGRPHTALPTGTRSLAPTSCLPGVPGLAQPCPPAHSDADSQES